ncbi:MAG: hypothetical protein AAFR17_12410 [Pseudomonadota bacterium]
MQSWLTTTQLIVGLISAAGGFVFYLLRQRGAISAEIEDSEARVQAQVEAQAARIHDLERELATMAMELRGLPTRDDLSAIQIGLVELTGMVRLQGERIESTTQIMTRIENMVGRHESHLLGGGGGNS